MSVDAEAGHMAQWRVPAHRAYLAMRVRGGSATQGPRWCTFGTASLASGADYVRLCRRAPGVGIPAMQRRHNRAAGSVDMTLHGMRR
jgi:hypothetical protein